MMEFDFYYIVIEYDTIIFSNNDMATTKDVFIRLANYIAGDKTGCAPPASLLSTITRLVAEIDNRHDILLNAMVLRSRSSTNHCDTCSNIIREIFKYQNVHWGRVVVTYAWLRRTRPHTDDCISRIADIICPWIDAQPHKWDALNEYFREESLLERVFNELFNIFTLLF